MCPHRNLNSYSVYSLFRVLWVLSTNRCVQASRQPGWHFVVTIWAASTMICFSQRCLHHQRKPSTSTLLWAAATPFLWSSSTTPAPKLSTHARQENIRHSNFKCRLCVFCSIYPPSEAFTNHWASYSMNETFSKGCLANHAHQFTNQPVKTPIWIVLWFWGNFVKSEKKVLFTVSAQKENVLRVSSPLILTNFWENSMMGWSGVNRLGKWFKGWLLGLTCWHLLYLAWWCQIVFPFMKRNSYFKTTKLPRQSQRFVCGCVIPCLFSLSCRLIAWTSLWTRVSLLLQVSRRGQRPAWRFALNLISWGKWEASSNCPQA